MLFGEGCIVDHNLTQDRHLMLNSIMQQNLMIVDETFADSLSPVSIATMSDGEPNTINLGSTKCNDEQSFRYVNSIIK